MGSLATTYVPLLQSIDTDSKYPKKASVLVSTVKWMLQILMWVIFVSWVTLMFLYPLDFSQVQIWTAAADGTVFGLTGSVFLIFSGPILIITFLAIAYICLSSNEDFHQLVMLNILMPMLLYFLLIFHLTCNMLLAFLYIVNIRKKSKFPKFRLWTFPVLIDGPFGIVSAAELIGVLLFSAYVLFQVYVYITKDLRLMSKFELPSKEKSYFMLELTGLRFGQIGLFCIVFLFLPISRGSFLLRLIDIPFEHATRYHVWLGHLTMALLTLHGLFYIIGWAMQEKLLDEMLQWTDIGIANLPGVISLLAGLLMWATSLPLVRKKSFELFFFTHQLYIIFIVFFAFHVGDFLFSIIAGAIFIFMLDRFLRFCQSQKTVEVISATCLPCGTVELVLSKSANLRYNALSFVFLKVKELSWLEWHPFSVSSSPLDSKHHISVLIKVLGGWTKKLSDNISNVPHELKIGLSCKVITASVEGPYGHESAYHLMYDNLILVAGGIGISPFIAILRDILHRARDSKHYPKNILIVWAVKKSIELSLLTTTDLEVICPYFPDKLHIEVQAYVTQESEPPLEQGEIFQKRMKESYSHAPVRQNRSISSLVGTGDNKWSGAYVIVSTVGFLIILALMDSLYITPYDVSTWWIKAALFIMCMLLGVLVFGGPVVILWHFSERKISEPLENNVDNEPEEYISGMSHQESKDTYIFTRYGCRPDFRDIFRGVGENWGHVDVGVIVCGPESLEASVAKECRSKNFSAGKILPYFHFNSHSFDL